MSSRESDSAYPPRRPGGNSGRRPGEGPDAYPSGTPPYGTGLPGGHAADPFGPGGTPGRRLGEDPAATEPGADDDTPKTETTLTTRIRINIPGSRPIPPVVMRSPVKNEESAAPAEPSGPNGPRHRSATPSSPVLGVMDPDPRASTPPNLPPEWQNAGQQAAPQPQSGSSDSTGEWFRPRQRGRQQDAGPAPTGPGAGVSAAMAGAAAGATAAGARNEGGRPGGTATQTGQERMPGQEPAPRGQGAPEQGLPGRADQARPGAGGVPGARPAGPQASPFAADGQQRQPDGFVQDAGRGGAFGAGGPATNDPYSAAPYRENAVEPGQGFPAAGNRQATDPFAPGPARGGRFAGAPAQADPFAAAPAKGDPFAGNPVPGGRFAGGPAPADPFATGPGQTDPFATRPGQGDPFRTEAAAPRRRAAPKQADPAGGPGSAAGEPEDTQIGGFEPIGQDPQHGGISGLPAANRFGAAPPPAAGTDPFAPGRPGAQATSTSDRPHPFPDGRPTQGRFAESPGFEAPAPFPGVPGAPAGPPFGAAPKGAEPGGNAEAPASPEAGKSAGPDAKAPQPKAASGSSAPAKSRGGRVKKLAGYAVGGVLFAGAAAYGTGLMLNQSDIPKGTTVLGTDIGGDSRDQAVSTLDSSVGKAGQQPLKLKLGDQTVNLDPATAGLSFDTTATVDGLTKHTYDPVAVIGSLSGGSTAVEPQVKVDRAKLKAALQTLSGSSAQGLQEGFVRFTAAGQTEVVPGKAGQAVDANAAMDLIEQAYRDRAAGKPDAVVTVPVAAAQPKVTEDALRAAADSLGKSVLNGTVTVYAGTKSFDFGKVTASQALTLAPDDSGKIVLKWDLDKLNDALKKVSFDKVKIKKDGAPVQVTPQDVADGIASVIDKTAAKDRVYRFQV
ncbi:hypothetical protein [Kitasatospora sp. NPDC001175]|uniref:hypothetical protein n=1 Tax=Kitasatospora sp. NPDC001175 TaxID=3157103 RepID=UPI003D05C2BB